MPVHKSVDKTFFKFWSPEMAYILGFFFADGSFDITKRGAHYFSFQITDRSLLEAVRRALQSDHMISVRQRVLQTEATQYRLQIGSKEMCADLQQLGITTQKASVMKMPRVPRRMIGHFVRGYFDGDGHVWCGLIHKDRKTQHLMLQTGFTSGSRPFLVDLHRVLKILGITGGGVYCKKRGFCLKYSTSDSLKLYKLMYTPLGTSDLFLLRKKEVFDKYQQQCGGSSTG